MDGISNVINNTTNSSTPATKGKSAMGKDDFMKLMIAQLKYQDPMNPMDGSQYSAQLAQFSSLEQLTNLNDFVKQSIDANYLLTQSVNNTMSATLIGKEVKLTGTDIQNSGQTKCSYGYTLPADASSVDIKIYNEQGALVKTINDEKTSAGTHKLSWDFTDNNGVRVPVGKYSIKIEAKTMGNEDMTIDTFKTGTIDGIRFTESGAMLLVDGVEYKPSDIYEILNTTNNTTTNIKGGIAEWLK